MSIHEMDATSARTQNIRRHVERAGGPTAFANKYGSGRWTQEQVSQWINVKKPKSIGGRLARNLEAELKLDRGALDRWDEYGEGDSTSLKPLQIREKHIEYRSLGEAAKNSIDSIVRSVGGSDASIAEVAELVADATPKSLGDKLLRKEDPAVRHEMSAQQRRLVRVVKMLAGRLTNEEANSFAQLIEAAAGRRLPE